jgi:bifunctional non-homologous end joining protein LigD
MRANTRKLTRTKVAKDTASGPPLVEPMLATLVRNPFRSDEFLYELKWDGYRVLSHVINGEVKLYSRGLQNYTAKYPPIVEELQALNNDVIIDGEVVVLDENGHPNFDMLQNFRLGDPIAYMVFDLVWMDGQSLMQKQLDERKELLKRILPGSDLIQFSQSYDNGPALFEKTKELGLEGIVAKKRDSPYRPGKRTMDWQKIQTVKQQEFVVGGWAESTSGRAFRTLIFGYYQNGKLVYQGHSGGGFKEKDMAAIYKRLQKLEIKKSPFENSEVVLQYTETPVHWVKPELVIQVKYATTTKSGMIRKPATFLGFRDDKDPRDVVLEKAVVVQEDKRQRFRASPIKLKTEKESTLSQNFKETASASNWPKLDEEKVRDMKRLNVEGHIVELRNPNKVLWKQSNITKNDLVEYYNQVYSFMEPHLQGRPLSLHIKNIAPTVKGFYIKDMEDRQPRWAEVYRTARKNEKEGKRDIIDYLVCNHPAALTWQVSLGCIDFNPWTSNVGTPDQPDYIIIDLDPSKNNEDDKHFDAAGFAKAVDVAQVAREYFKKFKLTGFAKTSGKTGIHLYVPCRGISFEQARIYAETICSHLHELKPEITTTNVSKNARGNKVYLDPNQNDFADTVAAPYSIRPFGIPTVSTPLEWKEIKPGLDPTNFTMGTIQKRLQKKGDLFVDVLDEKIAYTNTKQLANFM